MKTAMGFPMSVSRFRLVTNGRAAALVVLLGFAPAVSAHEFWIEPSTYTPHLGHRIDVALRVGENFAGQPVPRKVSRIERFAMVSLGRTGRPSHDVEIAGRDGDDPAGGVSSAAAGAVILVYVSDHASIELDRGKFDAYLKEKGLDAIRKQLEEEASAKKPEGDSAAQPAKSITEIYSRCAKSLIRVAGRAMDRGFLPTGGSSDGPDGGDKPAGGESADDALTADVAVGMPLELVALFDPYADPPPAQMKFRVLFNGRPLAGMQVTARARDDKQPPQVGRSGEEGEVTFQLTGPGPWLVEGTHMTPLPDDADADYESFWASVTFMSPHAAAEKADKQDGGE